MKLIFVLTLQLIYAYGGLLEEAIMLSEKGDLTGALEYFKMDHSLKNSVTSHMNIGVCLMRLNKLKEAEHAFLEAEKKATSFTEKNYVTQNLDVLESHFAFRRGESIEGVSYRRRTNWGNSYDPILEPNVLTEKPFIPQRPSVEEGLPFLRYTSVEDVNNRSIPFVITSALDTWKFPEKLDNGGWVDVLTYNFGDEVADYYPNNMIQSKGVYLYKVSAAVDDFQQASVDSPKYLHLQLTPKMWTMLEDSNLIDSRRHEWLSNDEWWKTCLSEEQAEEWHIKTHWKIMIVGSKGAGMFNHSDSLLTSSWHAHLAGQKWWYVCSENVCYEGVMNTGDILYYPPTWYHETRNLHTPTITVTDTVMDYSNAMGILTKMMNECSKSELNFDVSSKLCDSMNCVVNYFNITPPTFPWRNIASAEMIKKRESIMPYHNNYDGRNYISV